MRIERESEGRKKKRKVAMSHVVECREEKEGGGTSSTYTLLNRLGKGMGGGVLYSSAEGCMQGIVGQ